MVLLRVRVGAGRGGEEQLRERRRESGRYGVTHRHDMRLVATNSLVRSPFEFSLQAKVCASFSVQGQGGG